MEKPATLLQEIITTVSRFPDSRRRRTNAEDGELAIATQSLEYLISQQAFLNKFGNSNITEPKEIGRGWHGVTYRIGDYVMKIQHSTGPVEGFEYPQTEEGAQLAKVHLDTMRIRANKHNLPYLIPEKQDIFYVPLSGNGEEGRIATIQEYYPQLYIPHDIMPMVTDKFLRTQLREEFGRFMTFYIDSTLHDGLLADVFGFRNLALREIDGTLHFVLLDVGPVDRGIAGPIAQIGMAGAFVKEIIKWQTALTVSSLGRKKRTF